MSPWQQALRKAFEGERLSARECLQLTECDNLPLLGTAANRVRMRHNPEPVVTYVVGRNINYTNVCWVGCRFCAFYRRPGSPEGYVLTTDEILAKIAEMVELGGTEVLLQGGLNPRLKITWFEELFRSVKSVFRNGNVTLHALSPAEICYIARISRISLEECLIRLREAGLDSVPGGGAEILTERVRREIAPLKITADEWLDCMATAHRIGLRTTATMMYGSVDTWEDRVEHLLRLRELQDTTSGFTAFIPWSFQPGGTDLGGRRTGAHEYLKTLAISRIILDNVPHFQVSWVTQGPRIAQIGLYYGADDFGSTMMEENVVSSAGCTFRLAIEEIERIIRAAGFAPQRRNTQYERLTRLSAP